MIVIHLLVEIEIDITPVCTSLCIVLKEGKWDLVVFIWIS